MSPPPEKTPPAIVLAGGFGTRLQSVLNELPKPMAPVNSKPFLHYVFQYLSKQKINAVILSVGYKHESIKSFFGNEYLGITIRYSIEKEALGTGGGIKQAFNAVEDCAFVLNGDTLFDIPLVELQNLYITGQCDITIALKALSNFDRYGTVLMDQSQRITQFEEKKELRYGVINGGIYFFSKKLFERIETPEKFSFEKDVLEKHVSDLKIAGKLFEDYFIDIGIPEDYNRAQKELGTIVL